MNTGSSRDSRPWKLATGLEAIASPLPLSCAASVLLLLLLLLLASVSNSFLLLLVRHLLLLAWHLFLLCYVLSRSPFQAVSTPNFQGRPP